ncbi:HdeD family acid-resistance protein [Olivibacter sp. SDN3]|uniref:HdeD family acid-resistance protein n=1 Tax=Olivibacter sp. SDN3 TaxID=2764720 RepID=UPI001650EFBE|nr:HdeD family acid-resistance protein [Olivibacter sp. SDN3]QNL50725.1 HdeD family acid-resistance protein [Olivibacter sp. SDN3]
MASLVQQIKNDIKNWWLFTLIGILLLIAGFYTISNPLTSYLGLAIFFGVLIFVNGIMELSFAIGNRKHLHRWGWTLAAGMLDVILGFVLLLYPGLSMSVLPFIVGFYILLLGASLSSYAFQLNSLSIKGWGWVLAGGILTVIFGLSMIFNPIIGIATIVGWTAFAFIIAGIVNIIFSIQLKKVKDHTTP